MELEEPAHDDPAKMSWTIQQFPLPSDADLQAIVAYVNENYETLRQAKADTYTYGWGALNGDPEALLRYSQALATIERIQSRFQELITSEIVWNDGTTSFGILYLQYVLDQSNYLAFQEFGVKFGYGTIENDSYTLGAEWDNYAINTYDGDDSVFLSSGTHRVLINLGTGNDTFTGSGGSDGALGGEGNDVLRGGGNVDVLDGGLGDDKLFGDSGNDLLYGGEGNDIVNGGIGTDFMEGGLGNDTYIVDNTGDIVTEAVGAGTENVQSSVTHTLTANVENLTLTGAAIINGTGNELNNVLMGNSAANILSGGLGNDTYIIGAGDSVTEAAGAGTDTVQSSVTHTLAANVENLTLTGSTVINGTGNNLNNVLTGNSAANILSGGLGNDTYTIGAGDSVVEASGAGTDTVQSSVTHTLAANVENLTLKGSAVINGTGNDLNNILTGNSTANTLSGGLGNDTYIIGAGDSVVEAVGAGSDNVQSSVTHTLAANVENLTLTGSAVVNGTGNDLNNILTGNSAANILSGGLGNDTYIIGAGDSVIEAAGAGTDTVQSSVTHTLAANFENLTLTGTTIINGTGNELNNVLTGNSAANILSGGLGNDRYVIDGGDSVVEAAGAGTDTVQSAVTHTLTANIENLTLTGSAIINGTGNDLNNVLTGNSAANNLNGAAGADTIWGGTGRDSLTGSTGIDKFVYKSVSESGIGSTLRDVITDFQGSAGEKIDLSAIDAYSGALDNQAFTFIESNAFSGAKGEVRFSSGILQVNAGTDTVADMEIALIGVTEFQSGFLVL